MTTDPTRNPTWISDWRPEDEAFWNATGKTIARRNLIWSIVAEHIGFSVWLIWSIVTTKLPQAGFHYTTDQLFQLVAVPGLIGALMRFPTPSRSRPLAAATGPSSARRSFSSRRCRLPIS